METNTRWFGGPRAFSIAVVTSLVAISVVLIEHGTGVGRLPRKPSAPSIRQVLAEAWNVRVLVPATDGVTSSVLSLTEKSGDSAPGTSSAMLASLKRTSRYNLPRPRARPDLEVQVSYDYGGLLKLGRSNRIGYQYVSTTGELGRGNDWCIVPEDFRQLLRDRYLKTPKRHFRRTRTAGVEVIEEIVPRKPPLGEVEAQSGRWHDFRVVDDVPPHQRMPLLAQGAVSYEAKYWLGGVHGERGAANRRFVVPTTTPTHTWPPSYAGKTIYYRFRWKYDDGTYGPWSKTVSAKVLP